MPLLFALVALVVTLTPTREVAAQAPTDSPQSLVGSWQGAVTAGPNAFRIGMVVMTTASGVEAYLVSIDQDSSRLPVGQITLTGSDVRLDLPAIRGNYAGTLSADGSEIVGTLTQGMPLPLTFKRVDKLDAPLTFADAEHADVRALITRYFEAFTAQDWDTFRTLVTVPLTLWNVGAAPTVIISQDDAVNRSKGTRTGLDGTDYATSRVVKMIITPLTGSSALVDLHWRRDKKDGSLFGEGAEILTVVRTAGGWKVNGNIPRQLSLLGKQF
jgi:hypothetical protein